MKRIKDRMRNCKLCNKEFDAFYKGNWRTYCSKECWNNYQGKYRFTGKCPTCEAVITRKRSQADKLNGNPCCSRECRAEYLKTFYKGERNPNYRYSPLEHAFRIRIESKKTYCRNNNIPFNLSLSHLVSLYEKQKGECYYTKIPMKLISERDEAFLEPDMDVLSIDRIVPELGYVDGNLVLCCNGVNKFKGSHKQEKFIELLKYIQRLHSMDNIKAKITKLTSTAILPQKPRVGDIGYDIYVDSYEDMGNIVKVKTGIAIQPEIGWYFDLVPRSSIVKKGLFLINSVGVIDPSYQGEVMAFFGKLDNFSGIVNGERLLQLIPRKYALVDFQEVASFESESNRGTGGFGSTGS